MCESLRKHLNKKWIFSAHQIIGSDSKQGKEGLTQGTSLLGGGVYSNMLELGSLGHASHESF